MRKKKEKKIDAAEDWTQDPLQNKGSRHGLICTATELFYVNSSQLKLYTFKYEQNNNGLLKIYKNKQADTL